MDNINEITGRLENEGIHLYKKSIIEKDGLIYFLTNTKRKKYICISGSKELIKEAGFEPLTGKEICPGGKYTYLFKTSPDSIQKLMNLFTFMNPVPLGSEASFGFGDRLGLATPGHIRAISGYKDKVLPVFAQQSVRELSITGRKFDDVKRSAALAVFEQGYRGKWGADADHIKNRKDFIDAVKAGFTMYTLDTTDFLKEGEEALNNKKNNDRIIKKIKKIIDKYAGKKYRLKEYTLSFDEDSIKRIMILYGRAIDFIDEVFHMLKGRLKDFDMEISFDETSTYTTPEAHFLVSEILRKKGIFFKSLALRFPGIFEKGIEYRGSLEEFSKSVKTHNEIRNHIGGYKLSLHSGSDKFSIYPAFTRYTEGNLHIKTSGTSWLEALRVIASGKPGLFREIYELAFMTFDMNKKSYHMDMEKTELPESLNNFKDGELGALIYKKEVRQPLHISYGPVLKKFKKEIYDVLLDNEDKHYDFVRQYLGRHLEAMSI